MDEQQGVIEQVAFLLDQGRFGVLTTCRPDGQPYASLVAVCGNEGITQLLFATFRSTRKFTNLESEPRVAVLMDNRSNTESDFREAIAATFIGDAVELTGRQREELARIFLNKHPALRDFIESPNCALMKVRVRFIHAVSHFQSVMEIHIESGEPRVIDPALK